MSFTSPTKTNRSQISALLKFVLVNVLVLLLPNNPSGGTGNRERGKIKVVSTPFGVIRGQTIHFTKHSNTELSPVTEFLGIPFGMAPTGQTRFNMAVSAAKWNNQPKDAFKISPACIQSGPFDQRESEGLKRTTSQNFDRVRKMLPFLQPQSEDCLHMNLFVPEVDEYNLPLPVLVVIHGGEYVWGSGNVYNASFLASFGKIVVVTLNYRIGVLGWLGKCEPELSCSGNAGLSDLVAALNMLNNILPAFGADPSSLTLLGWESGASLVSFLMVSPITQPKHRLFRRAIILDGSALAPWAVSDSPHTTFMDIATNLSCYDPKASSGKNQFPVELKKIFRCVQEHSSYNLSKAAGQIKAPTFLTAFGPMVDGSIVPNHPKVLFSPKFGTLFRDIDLLVGTVSNPAHHLLPSSDAEHGVSMERRNKILRSLITNLYDYHQTEIFHAILNEYTDWENPNDHPRALRSRLLGVLNDALFTAPLVETARLHASEKGNTFFFVFAYESSNWVKDRLMGGDKGSLTEDYLPFIFGYPLASEYVKRTDDNHRFQVYGSEFSADDKVISRVMMNYISNFVKSGNPSAKINQPASSSTEDRFYSITWPEFSQATREAYLEINDRPRIKNFYRNAFVSFWNMFIPIMNRQRAKNVPEEHNFLTDHLNQQSFYGTIRSYSSFQNIPFPPPPPPPTPFPSDTKKQLSTGTQLQSSTDSSVEKVRGETSTISVASYLNNYWVIGMIGTLFLILHLCLYAAWLNKCFERSRENKMFANNYQRYQTRVGQSLLPSMDANDPLLGSGNTNYMPNSVPFGGVPHHCVLTASRSITTNGSGEKRSVGLGQGERRTSFIEVSDTTSQNDAGDFKRNAWNSTILRTNAGFNGNGTICEGIPRKSVHESEDDGISIVLRSKMSNMKEDPLLCPNNARAIGAGISPTCPRHGRAVRMMAANTNQMEFSSPCVMAPNHPTLALFVNPENPNLKPNSTIDEVQV